MNKQDQIIVINKAIEILQTKEICNGNPVLCPILTASLAIHLRISFLSVNKVEQYIPLFTRENAVLHANALTFEIYRNSAWWQPYNYADRLAFLRWILMELYNED